MPGQFPTATAGASWQSSGTYGTQIPNGKFVPEIWSGHMLINYYNRAIFPQICNTDYEGEIKDFGDKVNIARDPVVAIYDYSRGLDLTVQQVNDEGTSLEINRGKYYNFPVDDVDRRQSHVPWVKKITGQAVDRTKIAIETEIFGSVYTSVPDDTYHTINTITGETINGVNKNNVHELLVEIGVRMDDNAVPEEGRWVVVPNWMVGMIKLNDNFIDASKMGLPKSMILAGVKGEIDRLKIFGSTRLSTHTVNNTTHWRVLAGHTQAISFATQFVKTETLRNPKSFGDLIRGLQVYGFKVLQPSLLYLADVYKAL